MSKPKNPAQGGRYFKASPDAEPILVSGTDRTPSDQDKRALEAARKPKAQPTVKDGGDKL